MNSAPVAEDHAEEIEAEGVLVMTQQLPQFRLYDGNVLQVIATGGCNRLFYDRLFCSRLFYDRLFCSRLSATLPTEARVSKRKRSELSNL